jgi:predicted dienelactone hydrolase
VERLRGVAHTLAVLTLALPLPPALASDGASHVAADIYAAGETARRTTSPTAAARNAGDAAMRVLLWFPARAGTQEREIIVGPADRPVFVAGRAAVDAEWGSPSPTPLVLLSHGFGGSARQMTWLGTALARAGYLALALDHPGTNGIDGINAAGAYAPWARATDLSAALDDLIADPAWGPRVDRDRIAVAGFSLGGWTAALLVGARADFGAFDRFCASEERDSICEPQVEFPLDLIGRRRAVLADPALAQLARGESSSHRDPRIRAAFLIAPALGRALDRRSLADVRVPVAVIVGSADPITRPQTNAEFIARAIPGAMLLTLSGVAHYDFLSPCGAGGADAMPYCADGPGTRRHETHAAAVEALLAFLARTIPLSR